MIHIDLSSNDETVNPINATRPLKQMKLNDAAKFLDSLLKENKLLPPETTFYWYQNRELTREERL